ncbi:MAG: hypothetical protein AAFR61_06200 [Bacteroidota bacterium]
MDQDLHSTYLGDFWELVESVKVGESLMAMKDNRPDEISQEDRQPYTEALQELSAEEIADYLGTLFQAYQIYSSMSHTSLRMDWDREAGRFRILEKLNPAKPLSFLEFLATYPRYGPMC